MSKAKEFLERHGMSPERIQPARDAEAMAIEMELGLMGAPSSLAMIPTYLSDEGEIPLNTPVAVIDAGGTNFRSALVRFTEEGCRVERMEKRKMPGIDKPATWEEFIAFAADGIEPFMAETDRIGFCFSYQAEITPEMDGLVDRIDKEVVITGCEGQLVGASLLKELEKRGITGKKVVILNDTVAVLLGGLALSGRASGEPVGQVSGTGSNTCCVLPTVRIGKLEQDSLRRMVVNLESGMYDGLPEGDQDRILDRMSHNPGSKAFEKMTAGVYLGELCHLLLLDAAKEGELSAESAEKVRALGHIDSAVIDAWACGEDLDSIAVGAEDQAFVREICTAVFRRSARCMCTNLAAILMLNGGGVDPEKPARICAEGSLVQKGRVYRPELERLLREEIGGKMGLATVLIVGEETTLPGSAAAALLNA